MLLQKRVVAFQQQSVADFEFDIDGSAVIVGGRMSFGFTMGEFVRVAGLEDSLR